MSLVNEGTFYNLSGLLSTSTSKCIDYEFAGKLNALRRVLEFDLIACDAKWTLFVAAAVSYRYKTHLYPFPPQYYSRRKGRNIEKLLSVINDVPNFRILLHNISQEQYFELSAEAIDLVYWVLVILPQEVMYALDCSEYCKMVECLNLKSAYNLMPTHIFAVQTPKDEELQIFNIDQFPKRYAYYGNKLDTFFSILNKGFANLWELGGATSNSLPIPLNEDLLKALESSPTCAAWGASSCGSLISCVALCEFLDVPGQVNPDPNTTDVLVSSGDIVRVRYLLMYGKRLGRKEINVGTPKSLSDWISQHRYGVSLVCYILLLSALGLASSGSATLRGYINLKAKFLLELFKRMFTSE